MLELSNSLDKFIQRMNLAEKDELTELGYKLGSKNELLPPEKSPSKIQKLRTAVKKILDGIPKPFSYKRGGIGMSRRDFIWKAVGGATAGGLLFGSGLSNVFGHDEDLQNPIRPNPAEANTPGSLEARERAVPSVLESVREHIRLIFSTANVNISNLIDEINTRANEFATNHETPSPQSFEGWYTKFGPSSTARGQFLGNTDDINRQLDEERISITDLSENQRRLLSLRTAFDASGIDDRYVLTSSEYKRAFHAFLLEQGYEGVVAMKAPSDLGRTGFVSVWNKIEERWSNPIKVICLNTANWQTWNGLASDELPFNDYDGSYQAPMGWMLEVSDEVINVGGTEYDIEANASGFIRFTGEELPTNTTVKFPEYERVPLDFNEAAEELFDHIHDVFTANVNTDVASIISTMPETIMFGSAEYTMNRDTFIYYILTQLANTVFGESGYQFPIFNGIIANQLEDAFTTTEETNTTVGLPIGVGTTRELLNLLARSGTVTKKIFTDRQSGSIANSGFFTLESYDGGHRAVLHQGILLRGSSSSQFLFMDNGQVVTKNLIQMRSEYLTGQPNTRLVAYEARRSNHTTPGGAVRQ